MEDYMDKEDDKMYPFFDSSERTKKLCKKAIELGLHIILFCGGPFSGKRRQGREFARMLASSRNSSSYCFLIDLPFKLKYSKEASIESSIIKFVVTQMEQHKIEPFKEDIKEIQKSGFNLETFIDFFARAQSSSKFIFVFDDADVVAMKNMQDGFLDTLKMWIDKCRNVFVVLTTQFQYKIYRKCLKYICKPLKTKDAINFLKNEIQLTRKLSSNSTIKNPTDDECKELVEQVNCWPFLVMVVAQELEDYSAYQMLELLKSTPLLTLSNEAASQKDQLDYKLQRMFESMSDKLQELTTFFAPDVPKSFTVKEMMEVSKYEYSSFADAKQACLQPLSIRCLLWKPTDDVDSYNFITFMNEYVIDKALDSFPQSSFENSFIRKIVDLVSTCLNKAVKGDKFELKRCRQQAGEEFKAMLVQMGEFFKIHNSKDQDLEDFEKVIQAADDFLKQAIKRTDPEFREKANQAKVDYCKGRYRQNSKDSAFDSDENNSISPEEEPVARSTITPVVPESWKPSSLKSNADITGVEDPLVLQHQACYPQGPQSTAFRPDIDALTKIFHETSIGNNGEGRVVPSGYNSFPLNGT